MENEQLNQLKKEFKFLKQRKNYLYSLKKPLRLVKGVKKKVLNQMSRTFNLHKGKYKSEFQLFFQEHQSICAFDIEEIYDEIACIVAIKILPNMEYSLYLDVFKVKPSKGQSTKMIGEFIEWLKNQSDCPLLLIHGNNKTEAQIVNRSKLQFVNTQNIMEIAITQKIKPIPTNLGLDSFEKLIDFERRFCKMLKHKKEMTEKREKSFIGILFQSQAIVSFWSYFAKTPQHKCPLCNEEQDVILYCLEDVVVTLLIYVWYTNRKIEIY